ncbi:MAG: serine hydroxymethyltransferase [Actinomycetota bacterium]|nr:serine hydroxymethyltransferase [Actinomycetota bacterium]
MTDGEVSRAILRELERERNYINLIASENYAPLAILEAQGSIATNKYAEGYPSQRYYSGCEFVDEIESIAIGRAKLLFGCDHANVQPHSGTQANMAVYMAALEPGEKMMSMDLSCGGHLSHGLPSNFSGSIYRAVHYGLNPDTETIDYDAVWELAKEEQPKLIVAGASAYPRKIDFRRFKEIADSVGALLMVDMAHIAGLVAAGFHPDPVPYADFISSTTHKTLRGPRGGFILCKDGYRDAIDSAVFPGVQGGPLMHVIAAKAVCFKEAMSEDFRAYQQSVISNAKALAKKMSDEGFRIVSGGTDTHLFLVDLREVGITGREAEEALGSVGINVNKNNVPFDSTPPTIAGGIRIGTPAVTTRGMREEHMEVLGGLISRVLHNLGDEQVSREVKEEAEEFLSQFPLYPELGGVK